MSAEMFPAFIGKMPPSPESNRRYWTMYCRVCGIEERLAAGPGDPTLIAHTEAHNARFHGNERGEW